MNSVTINLDRGSKSKALEVHTRLERLLQDSITMFRDQLLYEYANTLAMYMQTTRFKVREAPHWVIELEPDEWRALSRGLRMMSNPAGSTMYQYLNMHKVEDHD